MQANESRQRRNHGNAGGNQLLGDRGSRCVNKEWQGRVERIQKLVETVPGVTTDITVPKEGNSYPTLTVHWDEQKFGLTVAECDQQLRAGEPRIEVLTNSNPSGVLARIKDGEAAHRRASRAESVADYLHDHAAR